MFIKNEMTNGREEIEKLSAEIFVTNSDTPFNMRCMIDVPTWKARELKTKINYAILLQ